MRIGAIIVVFVSALMALLFGFKSQQSENSLEFLDFNSYSTIYTLASDSLLSVENPDNTQCSLDSLFYFDPRGNKLVTCLHRKFSGKNFADELTFVYGEKISNHWFFFKGASYQLPRALFHKNDSSALSYAEFHQAALEDVFFPFALNGNFDFKTSVFFSAPPVPVTQNGNVDSKF